MLSLRLLNEDIFFQKNALLYLQVAKPLEPSKWSIIIKLIHLLKIKMRLEFWMVDLFSQHSLMLDILVAVTSFDFLVTMVSRFWTCSPMPCKVTTFGGFSVFVYSS